MVLMPSTYAYMADGFMALNGWDWHTVDPAYPAVVIGEKLRIDWTHTGTVNFLYGDGHAKREIQENARPRIRSNPLNTDPADCPPQVGPPSGVRA
jgi:prepilin-type processing-associated H-X9-DG protein